MSRLAVIVPVYNVEKLLPRCLDSILAQTYRDFTLILVNDGSTDGSGKICDGYAEKDERIRVIHKENGGLSSARNAGLEYQSNLDNEFIAFVDSDDYIKPEMYEAMISSLDESGADIAVCLWSYLHADGKVYDPENDERIVFPNGVLSGQEFLEKYLYVSYHSVTAVAVWNKVFSKHIFADPRFCGRRSEDEKIVSKIISFDYTVVTIKKSFYIYAENARSITSSQFNEQRLSMLSILIDRSKDFKDSEPLYRHTLSLFCDLTMEYYTRPEMKGKHHLFDGYIKEFRRIMKEEQTDMSEKARKRAEVFAFSPPLYRLLIELRRLVKK